MRHLLTCRIRLAWMGWRYGMPYWREDQTAQMLGVAQYGCPRCGRGAIEERDAADQPEPAGGPAGEAGDDERQKSA